MSRFTASALQFVLVLFTQLVSNPVSLSAQPVSERDFNAERSHFEFLIGDWGVEEFTDDEGTVHPGGDDLYSFKKVLDGAGIYSEWTFNRGTAEEPAYTRGIYVSAFDEMTGTWSFYYFSGQNAMHFRGRKENGTWFFYNTFDIDGDEFLQRQSWKPVDDTTVIRTIENSRDGGETWPERYARQLRKTSRLTTRTTVSNNTIVSDRFPPVIIEIDPSLSYLGSSEFVLYGVADTQIHVFAESEDGSRIRRLYWIQFEGYLPEVDRKYDYSDSEGSTEIGGYAYHEDTWYWDLGTADVREGSDTDEVLKLLGAAGLEATPEVFGTRLVRLDSGRRNELMIIYMEALDVSGLPADALTGPDRAQVVDDIRERALGGMQIVERAGTN